MPDILTSIHGRRVGLDSAGRLVNLPNTEETSHNVVPRVAYVNTAPSTTITNTTAETAFDTKYTIPANTLQPGSVIKVRWQGIAPSTNATDTLLIRLRLGGVAGTALAVGTATDVANNAVFGGDAAIIVRTIGAAGTFVAAGEHTEAPAASGTAVLDVFEITASTAIDTTVDQDLVVTATWSVASAANQVRLDVMVVEVA
jgi:hypothetical protein